MATKQPALPLRQTTRKTYLMCKICVCLYYFPISHLSKKQEAINGAEMTKTPMKEKALNVCVAMTY